MARALAKVEEFIRECCETGPGLYVRTADLEDAYRQWCTTRRMHSLPRYAFRASLRQLWFETGRSHRDDEGKQLRTWEGVALKAAHRAASSGEGEARGLGAVVLRPPCGPSGEPLQITVHPDPARPDLEIRVTWTRRVPRREVPWNG